VGLERVSLSLVSIIGELLERKNSGSGLKIQDHGLRNPSRLLRNTALSVKAGTNFADKRRSVGLVRSRTQAMEFVLFCFVLFANNLHSHGM
jgi:hypothetical protein